MTLTFIHGTMASSKSAALLMFRNRLPKDSAAIKIAIPFLGIAKIHIETRAPLLSIPIDLQLKAGDYSWLETINDSVKFLLIDECQFLDLENIDRIKVISKKVNVLCYGLLHDFRDQYFEGARYLNEVADRVVSIPSPCTLCLENFAECNMRESKGRMVLDGPQLLLKDEVNYIPVCRFCYEMKREEALK